MSSIIDSLVELERRIESTFAEETALARQKRDAGLSHIRALREGWCDTEQPNPMTLVETDSISIGVELNVSLKAALIEAVYALGSNITRGRALKWAFDKYPELKDSKEGTIASTFSRVKKDHLESMPDDPNLFRVIRKEKYEDTSARAG